ncbi:MAG: aldo/keto reductase [Propioniciclava sp.]
MEQRRIGDSDLYVSVIGMGCNNFSRPGSPTEDYPGSERVIHAAVDAGITFFDGADIYGTPQGRSEEYLGRALAGRRDQVVLSTKFGHFRSDLSGGEDWGPQGGARYVRNAVEGSLRRLGTETIDLLQLHWPDESTPIAETLAALTELVAAGKVRAVGHSNFSAAMMRAADEASQQHGFVRFVSAQNEYSLLQRAVEAGALAAADQLGLGFFPFYPLAAGLLTGKYSATAGEGRLSGGDRSQLDGVNWEQLTRYQQLCDQAGITPVQAAIAWLLTRQPVTSVIAGATRIDQVNQNAAAGEVVLDAATLEAFDELFATA